MLKYKSKLILSVLLIAMFSVVFSGCGKLSTEESELDAAESLFHDYLKEMVTVDYESYESLSVRLSEYYSPDISEYMTDPQKANEYEKEIKEKNFSSRYIDSETSERRIEKEADESFYIIEATVTAEIVSMDWAEDDQPYKFVKYSAYALFEDQEGQMKISYLDIDPYPEFFN